MFFHEKLTLLMNITNTSNSSLARSVCLDPSFISRLKNGKRKPASNQNYLRDMSYYLAKQCKTDSQKTILYKTLELKDTSYKYTLDHLSEYIYDWLSGDYNVHKAVEDFIGNVSSFQFKRCQEPQAIKESNLPKISVENGQVFYGIEGKRQAVISFLTEILKEKTTGTLLLFSDEPIDWMIEDTNFTRKWAGLLLKVIAKGNKIIIIHTINRSLDEILSAIREWLPIYMTGKIEPYHYPKERDRVFKKTLFIYSNRIALVSSSVGATSSNNPNFIYTDPTIVDSFSDEFFEYLDRCRPLVQIFSKEDKEDYKAILSEFEAEEGDTILKTDGLSLLSMPLEIIRDILLDLDRDELDSLYTYHKNRVSVFGKVLERNAFTEIIMLPDLEDIEKGRVEIHFSKMFTEKSLYYNRNQLIAHLKNIVSLMENYPNYNVHIDCKTENPVYSLYAKDDVGIIIAKEGSPPVVFALNERDMTHAFWDYADFIVNAFKRKNSNKDKSIKILNDLIKKIEKVS